MAVCMVCIPSYPKGLIVADTKDLYSFRLSKEASALLTAVADSLGISRTAVVELAVRDYADSRGISVQLDQEQNQLTNQTD